MKNQIIQIPALPAPTALSSQGDVLQPKRGKVLREKILTMKTQCMLLLLIGASAAFAADAVAPAATPAPPPAAPPKRSAAELEKLVAPIALYPDPLIATILPASVYPLEIVQAARFVADTNNLAKLDAQPWDTNVKAVARVPEVIKMLNDDLSWTMELGEAFLAQDKDLMDAMQSMRAKAQNVGTLKTSPQQIVTVTNLVIEKTVEQQVVVVTNTIVQIQPSNPQVVYVPTYNPAVVYYPPPPAYVGPPPVVSFAAGVAVGAIIANNCDWYHGGCYHGGDVDIDVDRNVNRNSNVNRNTSTSSAQQKWQPDQARMSKSGSPSTSSASKQARGYSSGGAGPSTQPSAANRASPSTGSAGARPSAGNASASRPAPSASASRPNTSPSASPSQAKAGSSLAKPSSSSPGGAFGGSSSGSSARADSSRGFSSRSSGGGGGGGRGGGGRGR